jgi:4-amino-4-deoxy-L-arabinose transferase-like glycosyltransferase
MDELDDQISVRNGRWTLAAIGLLALMALELIYVSLATSATWDEPHHLFDGYTVWTLHDYGLNPEVPPLVKLTAALPLIHAQLLVPAIQDRPVQTEAFLDGRTFVFGNGGDHVLFPARTACMVFTLALGWLIFAAAREMFGAPAGTLALALYVFDPNFLAHGALVTTDLGAACMFFATVYAWYRYTSSPGWGKLLIAAIAAGLALAVKFTGILVLAMLLLLVLFEALGQRSVKLFRRRILAFAFVAVVSYVVLWSFYGFRYVARPNGRPLHPVVAEYLKMLPDPNDERHLELLAQYHIVPEAYIWGLANTKLTENADTSYFFGHVYRHGNWKYFPAAFLIKSTLPFLVMLVLVPVAWFAGYWRRWRETVFLLVPVVLYLFVAMRSDMNIGMRHILPLYGFLYVLVAGAAVTLAARSRRWVWVYVALLVWQAVTSALAAPGYMAYANEAWGGPTQVHRYLSDANSDWGQQLKAAKRYLDERHITHCWFAYFPDGSIDPIDYGIDCKRLPTTDTLWWMNLPMDVPAAIDGTVLISDGDLEGIEFGQGTLNPYDDFRGRTPTKVIQGGLFIYDGHFEIPLASGLVHAQKAENLLTAGQPQAALTEAQQAVALAPKAVNTQTAMGDALKANGDQTGAASHYQVAIYAAETIEPSLQADDLPGLRKKLAAVQDAR